MIPFKCYYPCFLLAAGMLIASGPLLAKPAFSYELSEPRIALDTPVTLSITATWSKAEADYVFTLTPAALDNLELEDQGEGLESFVEGRREMLRKFFTLVYRPLKAGSASIRSLRVAYADPLKETGGSFVVPDLAVEVRGRKDPAVRIGLGLALTAAILAGLIALGVRARSKSPALPEGPVTLEAKAIARLQALDAGYDPDRKGEFVKDLHTILVDYLAARFAIDPARAGETGILEDLQARGFERSETAFIRSVFESLHAMRYAGEAPVKAKLDPLIAGIKKFIHSKTIVGNL
ncbi:MAG: hypothetical protein ACOY3K_00930 [Candidatus Omnitrophota bacterium]